MPPPLSQTFPKMDNDLHSRVTQLKHISLEIESELEYHRNLLNEMDNDMHNTSNILLESMSKVTKLIKTQSGNWVWIILLFIICVILYLVIY